MPRGSPRLQMPCPIRRGVPVPSFWQDPNAQEEAPPHESVPWLLQRASQVSAVCTQPSNVIVKAAPPVASAQEQSQGTRSSVLGREALQPAAGQDAVHTG